VYFNERIPINDSGISVGQLAIAKEIIEGWFYVLGSIRGSARS
jgi:hypothetical protein